MSRGSFAKKRLYPVAFMLAVTLVFISVTSVVYTFTGERIELNERLRLKQAVLYAAGVELPPDPSAIEKVFDGRVSAIKGDAGETRYYEVRAAASGDIEAYVIIYVGKGLWGEITASVGFDASLEACRGLEIIGQNETPGLGGRIDEAWFKEQFRGKRPPLSVVAEEAGTTEKEINGITGATYSTAAIQDLMNSAMEHARDEIRTTGGTGR